MLISKYVVAGIVSMAAFQAQAFNLENAVLNLAQSPRDAGIQTDFVLEELSKQENRQLPRLVHTELRLDRVSTEAGGRYSRHYTVLNERTVADNHQHFEKVVKPSLVQQICADPRQQIFLRNNITVVHYYNFRQEEHLAKLEVSPTDCR